MSKVFIWKKPPVFTTTSFGILHSAAKYVGKMEAKKQRVLHRIILNVEISIGQAQ